ncbi:MAG: FHA domain-containing protein [Fluviicola sp.]
MEIVRTIGSGLRNKIVINKPGIAEFHAEITYASGYLMMVEDLNSPSGTFINNRKIKGKKILKSGDILSFGDHVFPFEEHYPEMLKTQQDGAELDSGVDDGEPEEIRQFNDAEQEAVLSGLTGIKKFVYSLQFTKNRPRLQRIWMLVIASIMLLSLVLPWFSWSYPSNASFFINEKYEAMSAIETFIEMLEADISGAPFIYIALFGINMLLILHVFTAMLCYFLIAFKAWRPKNLLGIRRLSQAVLILYGVNFVFQFLRYVWYWLDGENNMLVSRMLSGVGVSESRIFIEFTGIGFWLCAFGVLLVLLSTRNGLWRPGFSRKWTTLSFTFWLPFVIMIALVHQGIGIGETNIDSENYRKAFGLSSSSFYNKKELNERTVRNAPISSHYAYTHLIDEIKQAEVDMRRAEIKDAVLEDTSKKTTRNILIFVVWVALHGLFIVSITQMFRKRVRGATTFVLSSLLLLFSVTLCISIYLLIGLRSDLLSQNYMTVSVGYGCYIAILASLGMLGEQIYFWTSKTEKKLVQETADTLDDSF